MVTWPAFRPNKDQGFTLIEMMIVVLIIGILLAVAIPTFLGSRGRADSRAAQSSLHNALTAEQTYFANNAVFGDTGSQPSIATVEPALTWQTGETTGPAPNTVTVTLATDSVSADSVYLQVQGKDGLCYELFQTNGTVPASGRATAFAVSTPASGQCAAPTVLTGPSTFPTVVSGDASDHPDGGFYTSW